MIKNKYSKSTMNIPCHIPNIAERNNCRYYRKKKAYDIYKYQCKYKPIKRNDILPCMKQKLWDVEDDN
jgi:hypothetical protein